METSIKNALYHQHKKHLAQLKKADKPFDPSYDKFDLKKERKKIVFLLEDSWVLNLEQCIKNWIPENRREEWTIWDKLYSKKYIESAILDQIYERYGTCSNEVQQFLKI
jgi:hypothetical protein